MARRLRQQQELQQAYLDGMIRHVPLSGDIHCNILEEAGVMAMGLDELELKRESALGPGCVKTFQDANPAQQ